jgi:hypothetical protein
MEGFVFYPVNSLKYHSSAKFTRARAQATATPVSKTGNASGKVTFQKVLHGSIPNVRTTEISSSSTASKAYRAAVTKNGTAIKSCAMMTAVNEKEMFIPPNHPFCPKTSRSPTPAKAGGATISI